MEIDCGRCEMRGTGCQDCVVTVLEPRNVASFSAAAPGYLGEAEVKALGVLAAAGMVPPLLLSLRGSALPGSALPGSALPGSALPGSTRPGSAILPGARAWTRRVFPDTKAS
jgi:hypothetical protein